MLSGWRGRQVCRSRKLMNKFLCMVRRTDYPLLLHIKNGNITETVEDATYRGSNWDLVHYVPIIPVQSNLSYIFLNLEIRSLWKCESIRRGRRHRRGSSSSIFPMISPAKYLSGQHIRTCLRARKIGRRTEEIHHELVHPSPHLRRPRLHQTLQ